MLSCRTAVVFQFPFSGKIWYNEIVPHKINQKSGTDGWIHRMEEKRSFYYQKIYDDLRSSILGENCHGGDLLPPENTIARDYGVDRSTVRKALKLLVDEGLVEKIPGKGTVVLERQRAPRAMAANPTHGSIGFLLPSGNAITQPFYATLFCVLERELKRFHYSLIYSTFNEQDDLMKTVADCGLDGIIFVSNTSGAQIGAALDAGIPCTLVNSYDPRIPSVLSDNVAGAYLAGKHLLDCGHRNVIILSGVRSYICSAERTEGFRRAFAEAGIKIPESSILPADSWEQESGLHAIKNYLSACKSLPTAIFCLNDRLAFGAMQAIRQCGLRVPEDISVVGYDNLYTQMSVIPLTTIEAHVESIAEATAQAQIWQQLGGKCVPLRINIPTELVEGETVRKL